ncbi:50S ribosomal protein L10 [soil metagenome]
MTREEKDTIIEELSEKLSKTTFFYITDTGGLSVAKVNSFRRMCFDRGVEYKVYKNTIIKKALEKLETDYSSFDKEVLTGFSGIIFSPETGNLPAKLIKDFRKKDRANTKPVLKGASIDSDLFIGDQNLDVLSDLKSKNELLGDIIGILQSPAKNVISALESGKHKLAGIVKTLSDR